MMKIFKLIGKLDDMGLNIESISNLLSHIDKDLLLDIASLYKEGMEAYKAFANDKPEEEKENELIEAIMQSYDTFENFKNLPDEVDETAKTVVTAMVRFIVK